MRVIVSAGGSGGHIYPALAIINKIKENESDSDILYIGTHNRMEKDIIPKHGIEYKSIKIIGISRRNPLKNFKTISYFIKAVKDAKKYIKEFNPDIVIGVGGYVTGPVIYAAKKLGYKTMINELDSVLGLSNRFLVKYADVIAVAFERTMEYIKDKKKVIYTGNPRSEETIKVSKGDKTKLGLSKNKKLVIIVMGSLGSKVINNKMKLMLQLFNNKEYEILFITGKDYYDEFKDLKLTSNVKIVPYVDKLPKLMKDADLMVSRAGSSTICEIQAVGIPTIFIPSPHVTSNHQYMNALDLQEKGAALLIEEKDLEGDILVRKIDYILSDKSKYLDLKNNLKDLAIVDSATRIYSIAKDLVDRRK